MTIPLEPSWRDLTELGLLEGFDPTFLVRGQWSCCCGAVVAKSTHRAAIRFCRACQQSALVIP